MSKLNRYWLWTLLGSLAVSAYPIYMGWKVIHYMAAEGSVPHGDFPKYIIPYTPIAIAVIALIPFEGMAARLAYYVLGLCIGSFGVGLIFHSYVTPGAYESFVKELAPKFGIELGKFKTGYDMCSLLVGVLFSFAFFGFGNFVGIRLGTVLCALVNGTLVAFSSRLVDKLFYFEDALPKLGKFFREL